MNRISHSFILLFYDKYYITQGNNHLYGAGHFELGGGLSLESRLGHSRRLLLFGRVGNSVCHRCVVSVIRAVWCINVCMCYMYGGDSRWLLVLRGVGNSFCHRCVGSVISAVWCINMCIPDGFLCLGESAIVSVIGVFGLS